MKQGVMIFSAILGAMVAVVIGVTGHLSMFEAYVVFWITWVGMYFMMKEV